MNKKLIIITLLFALLFQTSIVSFASDNMSVQKENENIIIDGICYSADMKTIIHITELFSGDIFVIPDGVTTVGEMAFYGSTIKEIYIADSVNKICKDAFFKSSIEIVHIGKNSKLTEIQENAFKNCTNLHVIFLPENITKIEPTAFNGCYNLYNINFWKNNYQDSLNLSPGDISFDGHITARDARLVLRIAAKLEGCSMFNYLMCDIDRNGTISAADARQILRTAAKL